VATWRTDAKIIKVEEKRENTIEILARGMKTTPMWSVIKQQRRSANPSLWLSGSKLI